MKQTIKETLANEPNLIISKTITVIIVLFLFYWSNTSIDFKGIEPGGLKIAHSIFGGIFHPAPGI